MTNEQKAKELYHEFEDATICGSPLSRGSVAFQASMEMAKWKDEQYEALLDYLIVAGADAEIIKEFINNFK